MDYSQLTDQDVVARAQRGLESAYRELIRRYERPVLSLIHRLVRDRELAEDLAQDTFIKVLKALHRYRPEYRFSSWIFKIAHNTALDQLRRRQPETLSLDGSPYAPDSFAAESGSIVPVSDEETPEEFVQNRELAAQIETALAGLRPAYRSAVLLWHLEGRPYEEIAEIMGLPVGTVKTHIHRARRELRERLLHLRAETR